MIGRSGEDLEDYASPACFLHELSQADSGLAVDPASLSGNIARWRRSTRASLIERRLSIAAEVRVDKTRAIMNALDALLEDVRGRRIAVYWPFRGEPDLRAWIDSLAARRAECSLPVVVEKNAPLVFRTWRQGEPLDCGVWNIPVPRGGRAAVPDIVVAPVVGFDANQFRLGYGGGYYDRTLAALAPRPLVVGVGYEEQAIPTIYPQPHDIAMDVIVTDRRAVFPSDAGNGTQGGL